MLNSRPAEEMQELFTQELNFLESCLRNNPKSYGTWHHRCFVMDTMPRPNWKHELQLCNLFLEYDERNCEYTSCLVRKPVIWFPNWSDTNQTVQSQKQVRNLKFLIQEEEKVYYPCRENKGVHQITVTEKILVFILAYVDSWISHEAAQLH